MRLIDELKWRELFFDQTDDGLGDFLEKEKVTFYLGADPTGDSLHVGHLVTYLVAKRLDNYGHKPILLIGGATGQIGDPKQQGERKMLDEDVITQNVIALTNQVKNIFGFDTIVNNLDWTKKIDLITYLRVYGKNFNVNNMINKDTVKSRLETGISYTEFSYQILQALDWHHLYINNGCNMQIGGQDQWGNITAGTDLIRKMCGPDEKVFGMTIPLIVKSDGTKFGKSEGGTSVWLDPNRTSPYEFYQFWINTPDSDVIKRLKQFTFLSIERIMEIEKEFTEQPHLRLAQRILASELTTFVHSKEACEEAIKISEALFSGDIKDLTARQIEMGFSDLPSLSIEDNQSLIDTLVLTGLASSKREARDFITSGAVNINGEKITDLDFIVSKEIAIEAKFVVLRRGKKKYAIIKF